MISTNKRVKQIQTYMRKNGWMVDWVIFVNLICQLEGSEKEKEFLDIVNKPDSLKSKDFFYQFKHLTTDNKGYFDENKLFNAWAAFDSATAN